MNQDVLPPPPNNIDIDTPKVSTEDEQYRESALKALQVEKDIQEQNRRAIETTNSAIYSKDPSICDVITLI
jgi:hypothetical protein